MRRCVECGCIMPDDHDGAMCEICVEERAGTIPDFLREEADTMNLYIYDIEVFS